MTEEEEEEKMKNVELASQLKIRPRWGPRITFHIPSLFQGILDHIRPVDEEEHLVQGWARFVGLIRA